MARTFKTMTTDELVAQLKEQKTSYEMDEDELEGCDWENGYNSMVEAVRVLLDNLNK